MSIGLGLVTLLFFIAILVVGAGTASFIALIVIGGIT